METGHIVIIMVNSKLHSWVLLQTQGSKCSSLLTRGFALTRIALPFIVSCGLQWLHGVCTIMYVQWLHIDLHCTVKFCPTENYVTTFQRYIRFHLSPQPFQVTEVAKVLRYSVSARTAGPAHANGRSSMAVGKPVCKGGKQCCGSNLYPSLSLLLQMSKVTMKPLKVSFKFFRCIKLQHEVNHCPFSLVKFQ